MTRGDVKTMSNVAVTARQAANSNTMSGLARFGLCARAFIYVMIGWLAIQIARGQSSQEANQRGAIADIAQHSFGIVVLWAVALGFAAYAVWRLTEAVVGTAAEGRKAGPRLKSLVRGIVYAALSVSTFAFIAGSSRQSQTQQQRSWTARMMQHDNGRWVVGIIGLVVILVGLGMIVEGITRKFRKELRTNDMSATTRPWVIRLGMVGTIARGLVFALAGGLVVDAAVTFDPSKSTGLDGALRTLADRAYGPWLLGAVALGLIAFGLYGFAAARWAKVL
jgi:uncharacterized membrane protein